MSSARPINSTDTQRPPRATLFTQSRSTVEASSFRRIPSTPARIDSVRSSDPSSPASNTTRVGRPSCRTVLRTSIPDSPGMTASRTATSGAFSRIASSAASPSRSRATISTSSFCARTAVSPSSMTGWSSARLIRIGMPGSPFSGL